MSIDRLRREYQQVTIGPLILAEVERVVRATVRRFDPVVYAGVPSWAEGHEDLVQEVVLRVLLEEHQLDYLMATARTTNDFRALLRRQVERQLARRRRRTVIDNLLDRCRDILRGDQYTSVRRGSRTYYHRSEDTDVEERAPTADELRRASLRVSVVPRVPFRDTDRAPQVYSTHNLACVVELVAASLPTWFETRDLDKILHDVLTGWVPSLLRSDDAVHLQVDTTLTPEEELVANSVSDQLFEGLTQEQLLIIVRKLEGSSDSEIAKELGVSRPTAAARKDDVLRVLEKGLEDLSPRLQAEVLDRLAVRAALEVADA
jgi:DNA-directed RNA polymerase specialized sigma24 family protein